VKSIGTTSPRKEFQTDTRLRFVQTAFGAFKFIASGFAVYAVLEIILHNSIHFPIGFVCFVIGVAVWLSYGNIAWGSGIRFGDSEIVLLRGQNEICHIPLSNVQDVKIEKRSITFKYYLYHLDSRPRFKRVARDGFSETCWQEFANYVASHIKTRKEQPTCN
jgi:hypothetical protein